MFFFFFSSRRRHTRFDCDWSSDVCSSDLSISSSLANLTTWETKASLSSDHIPIIITINTKSDFRLSPSNKTFKNYRKANWENFTDEIEHSLHEATTPDSVHSANNTLTNLILLADKHHIPKGRLKKLDQPLPQHSKDTIRERNILRNRNPTDSRITPLSNEITKQIGQYRSDQWKAKLEQVGNSKKNSHTLWKTINYLGGKIPPSQPDTIITFNDKPAISPQQKASSLTNNLSTPSNMLPKTPIGKLTNTPKPYHPARYT